MVKTIVELSEREDRVVQIVKGKYGIPTKAKAIAHIIDLYEEGMLEPTLRPEFVEEMRRIEKEPSISYHSVDAMFDDIEGRARKHKTSAPKGAEKTKKKRQ